MSEAYEEKDLFEPGCLVEIRIADPGDYADILDLYRPYVEETAISFEHTVPSIGEFTGRMSHIQEDLPLIVCRIDGELAGYAYASHYRSRTAYSWDVETSIYVREDYHRGGVGSALYQCLLSLLTSMNYRNAYACITASGKQSIRFHEKAGFTQCALFADCGYKFGMWHDIAWMDKKIGGSECGKRSPLSIHEISGSDIRKILDPEEKDLESRIRNDIMKCNDFLGNLFS